MVRAVSLVSVTLVVMLVAAWLLWRRSSRPLGPAGVAAAARVAVPETAAARALLGRWRDRARRWRSVAAFPAVLGSIVASLLARSEVTFGLVDTAGVAPIWADPLVVGLLAVALGAATAELHRLRPTDGPRTASLEPRDAAAVRRPGTRTRRVVLGVLTALLLVVHLLATWAGAGPHGVPWALVTAGAALVGGAAVERRIASRPRPALPEDLRVADVAVRRVAARSVDDAAAGATALLLGWGLLGGAGAVPRDGGELDVVLDAVAVLGTLTALTAAIVWAWRSVPHRLLAETTRTAT